MVLPEYAWMSVAGIVVFGVGLWVIRGELATAAGLEKLVVMGPVLYAAPLGVFGAEHLANARALMGAVPAWMPWHLFWVYFVGFALIGAALSIVTRRLVRWSGTLLGIMIFLFVVLIHIPNAAAHPPEPANRVVWAVIFREMAFASSAWALVGARTGGWRLFRGEWMVFAGRICMGLAAIFFAGLYFRFPGVAPTIPLEKMTPAWVPFPFFWGYLTGVVLLLGGLAILANLRSRVAATGLGIAMIAATLALYLPLLLMAHGPDALVEGVNYVADTLMFAGALLMLAEGMPRVKAARAALSVVGAAS